MKETALASDLFVARVGRSAPGSLYSLHIISRRLNLAIDRSMITIVSKGQYQRRLEVRSITPGQNFKIRNLEAS